MPKKGYKQTSEHRKNNRISHLGIKRKKFTRETIKRMCIAQQKKPNRFNITKKFLIKEYIKNNKSSFYIAKKIGCSHTIILRRLKQYNIPRRTRYEAMKGIPKPKGFGERISKRLKNMWNNPKLREERIKSIFDSFDIKPNKAEIKLNNFLNQLLQKEYKFVGDGKIFITGFVPDFININGQKKIIELYGDYWHRNTQEKDKFRINTFKKYGYKTLIIWEHELKDLDKVKNRILKFNRRTKCHLKE